MQNDCFFHHADPQVSLFQLHSEPFFTNTIANIEKIIEMTYSLAAKFTSEILATAFAIFLGTSAIANELLPSTKGHGQGYYSTCFGFTFAFVVSGTWFGPISAQMNPAMFFYLALRGELEGGWTEFAVGSAGSLIGAFIGGCLTFFYWASHFWTVPMPQDPDPVSRLINGHPDALSSNAGRLASAFGDNSRPDVGHTLKDEAVEFRQNLIAGGSTTLRLDSFTKEDNEDDGENRLRSNSVRSVKSNRSNSRSDMNINECERLFERMEQERKIRSESMAAGSDFFYNISTSTGDDSLSSSTGTDSEGSLVELAKKQEYSNNKASEYNANTMKSNDIGIPFTFLPENQQKPSHRRGANYSMVEQEEKASNPVQGNKVKGRFSNVSKHVRFPDGKKLRENGKKIREKLQMKSKRKEQQEKILDAAFRAAIQADQSAKLSIFCTRPAKYNRLANFLQETAATFFLIFGIHMLNLRLQFDDVANELTSPYTQGMLVTFYIIALCLGLGG